MRLIALLFFAALPSAVLAAAPAPDLAKVLGGLEKHALICADFEQEKSLSVLTHPLVSQGRMIFRRGAGVVWRVTSPIPAAVTLRKSSMTRWDDAGKGQVVDYDRSPLFGTLAETLVAIISGDVAVLERNFEVSLDSGAADDWKLTLTPKHADFARLVAGVEISGGDFAREIRIREGGGDRTVIRFRNVAFDSCRPTDTEKAFLAK